MKLKIIILSLIAFTIIFLRCKSSTSAPSIITYRCLSTADNMEKYVGKSFNLETWRTLAVEELTRQGKKSNAIIIKKCQKDNLIGYLSYYAGIDLE